MNSKPDSFSRIIFGCANFGGFGSNIETAGRGNSEAECYELLDAAYRYGIRRFDTANTYADGLSEIILGRWIKMRGSAFRDTIRVATKVGNAFGQNPLKRSLSPAHIQEEVRASLRRLQLSHVDIYLTHMPDPRTPLVSTLETLWNLMDQGLIRAYGSCNVDTSQINETVTLAKNRGKTKPFCFQNSLSLMHPHDAESIIPFLQAHGIEYWGYSPLDGGLLSGKYKRNHRPEDISRFALLAHIYQHKLTEPIFSKIEVLTEFSDQLGISLATLSYAWVLAQAQNAFPIVGPRKISHLEPVEQALRVKLSEIQLRTLTSIMSRPTSRE